MPFFLSFHEQAWKKKTTLDGIRTRNPQIRSLMRYPLRHERKTRVGTKQIDHVCVRNAGPGGQSKKNVMHTRWIENFVHIQDFIFSQCLLLKKSSLTGG